MKIKELDIDGWQKLVNQYRAAHPNAKPGAAIRIENTMLSPARYFGGMTYNGDQYTYFEPIDHRQPKNADGTPYVAWLMVRADFLQWATKELKRQAKEKKGGAK